MKTSLPLSPLFLAFALLLMLALELCAAPAPSGPFMASAGPAAPGGPTEPPGRTGSGVPGSSSAPESVTFIVTSDAHYDAFENEDRNLRNRATVEEMNRISEAVWPDEIGKGPISRPRGVLVLGDVIDDGDREVAGMNQGAEEWRRYLADFGLDGTDGILKYPVYDGWGNHDGPPAAREKYAFSFQAELKRRNAKRLETRLIAHVSKNGLHYSWDWGPVHLVQLNLYPGDRPHPKTRYSPVHHDPQGSLEFLKADLASSVGKSGRPVILLHHYDLQGSDWWQEDERRAYHAAIRDYNVVAIFHGHTATGVYPWKPPGADKAIDVVNTGQTERGFFVVEVSGERLRLAYRMKAYEGTKWDGRWTWSHLLNRSLPTPAPGAAAAKASQAEGSGKGLKRPVADKTLVAWVYLADTAQRGGSALTLMEGEDFDAVVFGERAPKRWMAGSDFFRRTQGEAEQALSPEEDADSRILIQVAIAYAGDRVSIYRGGKPYAAYTVDRPRAFGRGTSVLIGLRYLASMGAIGFLRGAVEEARVYDVAIDEKAVAALEPGKPSSPAPIACWTFEDGSAADSRGTFPPGELRGGARIEDGKLHLNGTDAYMVSEVPDDDDQVMFYAPKLRETGVMWDTWLYWREESQRQLGLDQLDRPERFGRREGTYYLFYLARTGSSWDNVSMATSPDGVHFKERGPILSKSDGVTWMGTGFTWKSPGSEKDGKFFLNFSEWRGDRQTIFFAESTDLLTWTRMGSELEFRQDARWYQPKGRWDCIYAISDGAGGLYGYWTADPIGRPGVGLGRSHDGVRWEALEPPLFLDGAPHGEAGAVEKLGERYYLMLGSGGNMLALVAEEPKGPFRPARRNLVLLHAGPTYFARFFPTSPDGVLVNHHSIAKNGKVHLGLLKTAIVDAEGALRLGWWKGNERLKHAPVEAEAPSTGARPIALLGGELPADEGVLLEGVVPVPAAGAKDAQAFGLYVEIEGGAGTAILVGAGGVTEFGRMQGDGSGFAADLRADREMAFGGTARFRLALKRWLLEFYLDDVLMECYSLPARATGRVGLVGPPERFGELKAWR